MAKQRKHSKRRTVKQKKRRMGNTKLRLRRVRTMHLKSGDIKIHVVDGLPRGIDADNFSADELVAYGTYTIAELGESPREYMNSIIDTIDKNNRGRN